MVKKDLISKVAQKYNIDHKWSYFTTNMVEGVLDSLVDVIINALMTEGKITIRGLVSLDVVDYGDQERVAWNPHTQELMAYIPKKKIRCRIGKTLRDAINGVQ